MHKHHAIDYVELTVSDLAEAKRFYTAAFDWGFTDYGPEYAGIQGGDRELGGLHQSVELRHGGRWSSSTRKISTPVSPRCGRLGARCSRSRSPSQADADFTSRTPAATSSQSGPRRSRSERRTPMRIKLSSVLVDDPSKALTCGNLIQTHRV